MKKLFLLLSVYAMVAVASCKKDKTEVKEVPETNVFSQNIYNIMPKSMMDTLIAKGMVLHPGTKPPVISNTYLLSPWVLKVRMDDSDYPVGYVFSDYKYRFYDQVGDQLKIDYKALGLTDEGFGLASYISGNGNSFSIFAELAGNAEGIIYKQVTVISGELTPNGITNLRYAFILTHKTGDENNAEMMPIGASRIIEDGDGISSVIGDFRISAEPPQQSGSMVSKKRSN